MQTDLSYGFVELQHYQKLPVQTEPEIKTVHNKD